MTHLRRRMIDDMTMRNFSPYTQRAYLFAVSRLARKFRMSPADLGPEHLREYLNFLIAEKRIKSFCGAKPPRKLRWTDAGRGRQVVGYGDFTQDAGWRGR